MCVPVWSEEVVRLQDACIEAGLAKWTEQDWLHVEKLVTLNDDEAEEYCRLHGLEHVEFEGSV